jgi:hypothetical protein
MGRICIHMGTNLSQAAVELEVLVHGHFGSAPIWGRVPPGPRANRPEWVLLAQKGSIRANYQPFLRALEERISKTFSDP